MTTMDVKTRITINLFEIESQSTLKHSKHLSNMRMAIWNIVYTGYIIIHY